jgi:hypothetical protein
VSPWRDRAIASEGSDANIDQAQQNAALIGQLRLTPLKSFIFGRSFCRVADDHLGSHAMKDQFSLGPGLVEDYDTVVGSASPGRSMPMRHINFALILFCALVRFDSVRAEDSFPGAEWQHAAPADLGWSEAGLAQARAFSDEIKSSAVMIVQHGKLVAE